MSRVFPLILLLCVVLFACDSGTAIVEPEGDPAAILDGFKDSLRDLFLVSQAGYQTSLGENSYHSEKFPSLFIEVVHAEGKKCERCWIWSEAVGRFPGHPTLCKRCHEALS